MLACVGVAPLGVVGGVVHAVSLDLEAHDADTKRRPGGAVLGGRFGGGGLLVVENGNSDVIVQGWLDGRRLVSSLRADHAPERETILINVGAIQHEVPLSRWKSI